MRNAGSVFTYVCVCFWAKVWLYEFSTPVPAAFLGSALFYLAGGWLLGAHDGVGSGFSGAQASLAHHSFQPALRTCVPHLGRAAGQSIDAPDVAVDSVECIGGAHGNAELVAVGACFDGVPGSFRLLLLLAAPRPAPLALAVALPPSAPH